MSRFRPINTFTGKDTFVFLIDFTGTNSSESQNHKVYHSKRKKDMSSESRPLIWTRVPSMLGDPQVSLPQNDVFVYLVSLIWLEINTIVNEN